MKGIFISFEGNDGSGKSSAIKAVYEKLIEKGYDVVLTREPGGSKISEKIRELILDIDNLGMDDRTEALLYAASRREHIVKTIIPALESGKVILCDRFLDSSLAYQGYARGIGIKEVFAMNSFATAGLLPDLTLFVCVHPEVGLARIKKNAREMDRLEVEKIEFHNRVYEGYMQLLEKNPERIKKIEGEQEQGVVACDAIKIVLDYIEGIKNESN